jgi:hypothetical protein
MSISYIVKIEEFAKSHYIKKFSKKYKNSWDITIRSILLELERFDEFIKTDHIDLISCCESIAIFKADFRIAGTKFSRKASGNRYIASLDKKKNEFRILLMYHKNDISDKNETAAWKKIIKDNYNSYDFLK